MVIETKATKHSPLPWRLKKKDPSQVVGADGFEVADASSVHLHETHDGNKGHWSARPGKSFREFSEEEEAANADLIVRAVNAYADLPDALYLLACMVAQWERFVGKPLTRRDGQPDTITLAAKLIKKHAALISTHAKARKAVLP